MPTAFLTGVLLLVGSQSLPRQTPRPLRSQECSIPLLQVVPPASGTMRVAVPPVVPVEPRMIPPVKPCDSQIAAPTFRPNP